MKKCRDCDNQVPTKGRDLCDECCTELAEQLFVEVCQVLKTSKQNNRSVSKI